MQIVFDSEEQKRSILDSFCVDELFIDRDIPCSNDCERCWEECGVEMEVEDNENHF